MQLLFDIGGTHTRMAVTLDGQSITNPVIFPTPQDFGQAIQTLTQATHQLIDGQRLESAAGGIAGPLNQNKTQLVNAPHLPQWVGQPIQSSLSQVFGCQVYLENDAALAGLGEAIYGAGVGKNILGYLTVSTGVGGVRVINQKIDNSFQGFEPGHQIIENSQTLEELVSGTALQKKYNQPPENIQDQKVWEEEARLVAIGVHNLIVLWSPERIVIGGGLSKHLSFGLIRDYLMRTMKIFGYIPEVVPASLGDMAGLYGALALNRNSLGASALLSSLPPLQ